MNQNKRLVSALMSGSFIALLILAVLGLQILVACHVHADGEDHANCPLCLISGTLQSSSVNRFIPGNPLHFIEKAYPAITSFICICFPGYHYPSCGPPYA
jgi:hypothetical protein